MLSWYRAVFKWLSNVITWLRLLCLVIGLKDRRQFLNKWEAKPKAVAPCTCDFSRALSELQVIARNYDWFVAMFAPVVIGRSNCFGFGFSTVIWKPLYPSSCNKGFWFAGNPFAMYCTCLQYGCYHVCLWFLFNFLLFSPVEKQFYWAHRWAKWKNLIWWLVR